MKLTKADIVKIQEEIEHRKINLRPELLKSLQEARAQGDLSENFEYTAAKRANNQNNSRIRYLEKMIQNAQIIEDHTAVDQVGLNKIVTIFIPEDGEEETYKLVTSIRGDSLQGRISTDSPLGKAMLGKKVGDVITIHVNDSYSYQAEIRSITSADADDNSDGIRAY